MQVRILGPLDLGLDRTGSRCPRATVGSSGRRRRETTRHSGGGRWSDPWEFAFLYRASDAADDTFEIQAPPPATVGYSSPSAICLVSMVGGEAVGLICQLRAGLFVPSVDAHGMLLSRRW